jgi:hypothetical protein
MRTEAFVLTFVGIWNGKYKKDNKTIAKYRKMVKSDKKAFTTAANLFRYRNLVLECTDFTGGFEPGSVVWGCADQQGTEKKIPNGLISKYKDK